MIKDKQRNYEDVLRKEIRNNDEYYTTTINEETKNYEKKLLDLYQENDRLKSILGTQHTLLSK